MFQLSAATLYCGFEIWVLVKTFCGLKLTSVLLVKEAFNRQSVTDEVH